MTEFVDVWLVYNKKDELIIISLMCRLVVIPGLIRTLELLLVRYRVTSCWSKVESVWETKQDKMAICRPDTSAQNPGYAWWGNSPVSRQKEVNRGEAAGYRWSWSLLFSALLSINFHQQAPASFNQVPVLTADQPPRWTHLICADCYCSSGLTEETNTDWDNTSDVLCSKAG